tara:strand:- start:727 stop:1233 length:507 start_codon:yes stop_codon:yes gene_type:complete
MNIKYPQSFWEIANQIGYARSVINKHLLKKNPRFDRGVKNKHVDTVGILGELIAINYLTEKKINYKMTKLLELYPSKNADVIIKDKKIDIKSTFHFENAHILVNKEAHKKGKNKIDKYWFIYILNKKEAEFYFLDYNEISKWKSKVMKYTEAYYIKREELKTKNERGK